MKRWYLFYINTANLNAISNKNLNLETSELIRISREIDLKSGHVWNTRFHWIRTNRPLCRSRDCKKQWIRGHEAARDFLLQKQHETAASGSTGLHLQMLVNSTAFRALIRRHVLHNRMLTSCQCFKSVVLKQSLSINNSRSISQQFDV